MSASPADAPSLTRWQQRRRDRKAFYDRLTGGLFLLIVLSVGVFYVVVTRVVAPVFGP
jgi:hypothetical protein